MGRPRHPPSAISEKTSPVLSSVGSFVRDGDQITGVAL